VLGDCNSKCARTLNYYSVLFWMEIVNAPSQHGNGRVYGMDEDTFSFLSLTSYDPQDNSLKHCSYPLTYTCLIVQLFSMMIFLSSPQYIPYRISKITKNHFINNNPTYNYTKHLLIIYSKINFVLVDNTNNFVTQEDTHYFLFDKMHT
jgi:hypothetical protein